MSARPRPDYTAFSDVELAGLIARSDAAAIRLVTERNNQRLFRAAWSILKDRAECEDAVQSAYLRGFAAIGSFAGRASLSTWLTRIVINEALGRLRVARRRRSHLERQGVIDLNQVREEMTRDPVQGMAPDAVVAQAQVRRMLEAAIDGLPQSFRSVFVLRDIEGLSVEETAVALDLLPATVKTRHLRARRRLRKALEPELESALTGSFPFAGADCEAMTARILTALSLPLSSGPDAVVDRLKRRKRGRTGNRGPWGTVCRRRSVEPAGREPIMS